MKTTLKALFFGLIVATALPLPAPTPEEMTTAMRTEAEALPDTSPVYVVNEVLGKIQDVIYWVDLNRGFLDSHNNPSFQHDDGTYYSKSELENLQVDYKEIYDSLAERFGLPKYASA